MVINRGVTYILFKNVYFMEFCAPVSDELFLAIMYRANQEQGYTHFICTSLAYFEISIVRC